MINPLHHSSETYLPENTIEENPIPNEDVKSGLNNLVSINFLAEIQLKISGTLYTLWDNKRMRWGMIILMIIAPIAKYFYLTLPVEGFGEYLINIGPIQIANTLEGHDTDWYYVFYIDYFWSIGELLTPLLSIYGIFLLFPEKYYPSYLVGVPFGYYLSLLIHRMFFVTNDDNFHNGGTVAMTIAYIVLGVVFFIVSDKVITHRTQKRQATEARIIGLINMPGMNWQDKESYIRKEVADVLKSENDELENSA